MVEQWLAVQILQALIMQLKNLQKLFSIWQKNFKQESISTCMIRGKLAFIQLINFQTFQKNENLLSEPLAVTPLRCQMYDQQKKKNYTNAWQRIKRRLCLQFPMILVIYCHQLMCYAKLVYRFIQVVMAFLTLGVLMFQVIYLKNYVIFVK